MSAETEPVALLNAFLKEHQISDYTVEDFESDRATLRELRQ